MLVHKMLLNYFFPTLIVSLLFFMTLLELADIFIHISDYILYKVPVSTIFLIAFYYLPKALSFALPVTLMFSASYTLGNFYHNNELIAILGMGVSFFRFVYPLLVLGLLFSIFLFFFNDQVVIPSYLKKQELTRKSTGKELATTKNNIVVREKNGHVIYDAISFDIKKMTLYNILAFQLEKNHNELLTRIDANSATWNNSKKLWIFYDARVYTKNPNQKSQNLYLSHYYDSYTNPHFNTHPAIFQIRDQSLDNVNFITATRWLRLKKNFGININHELSNYYQRISYSLVALIVMLFSCAIGSRFKKNILLFTLAGSLVIAMFYYILQLIIQLSIQNTVPILAAWLPDIISLALGIYLFTKARS